MTRITAALAVTCLAGTAVSQQTINVPNTLPTLSLALNPAVSGLSPGDIIELSPGTYFNSGDYEVTVPDITIRGLGAAPVTLDQFGTGRIFTVSVGASGSFTLENLRLINGDAGAGDGGAVFFGDGGTLTLIGCEFDNNTATRGGAIWAVNTAVVMQDCTLTGNSASSFGGALRSAGGGDASDSVTITGSTFTNNAANGGNGGNGGAIDHAGSVSPLTIVDSTFSGNTCTGTGGAVFTVNPTTVVVTGSMFSDNASLGTASQDTGGLFISNASDVTVRDCDFVRNLCPGSGGGLRFSGSSGRVIDSRFVENEASSGGAFQVLGDASAEIYNCAFIGNSALREGAELGRGGAIIANASTIEASLFVYNSIFDGNSGTGGGAIDAAAESNVTVVNSTFVNNTSDEFGSAIWQTSSTADLQVFNSAFSGNVPSGDQIRFNGSAVVQDASFNIINGSFTLPGSNNIEADPMFVDPSNGDYSLMPGSPAIDAGSSSLYLSPTLSDLAGNARAKDDPGTPDTGEAIIGAVIDMGAFEFTVDSGIPDCPADQNFDGQLTPADFNAWVLNFNAGCD
ncbi:MAG: choice-of-anchor Q domain-containing protein [Planctomycetota bacterium]